MLRVENLDFYIGAISILRGINMKIEKGEIVGLIGRNGAGKTSTLKNIIGIYRPRRGRIIFEERDITRLSPEKRVELGISYSPEDSRVFPELTVKENLLLALWTRNVKEDILDTVFEVFPEIKGFLERKGQHLSGGQKKMVAVARALAQDPKLLLLDEPFEGLSPAVVKRFKEAIKKIKRLGKTILLAEARIATIKDLVDRVYVIERGEIIFEGGPQDLLKNERIMRIVGR